MTNTKYTCDNNRLDDNHCGVFFNTYKQNPPKIRMLAYWELFKQSSRTRYFSYNFKQTSFQTHSQNSWAQVDSYISAERGPNFLLWQFKYPRCKLTLLYSKMNSLTHNQTKHIEFAAQNQSQKILSQFWTTEIFFFLHCFPRYLIVHWGTYFTWPDWSRLV